MDFVILFNDTIITKESPKKHLKHCSFIIKASFVWEIEAAVMDV